MGPLAGRTVVEIAAIGPVPFAGMLLSDLGARVIRVDRTRPGAFGAWSEPRFDVMGRGRESVALDLKDPRGVDAVLRLVEGADALVEGFRPGVAERLGIGPDVCMERNEALVYGRMTGWGQEGPLADAAGHDINYIALTGALASIGTASSGPVPPLNLVGDFGGGALYLVVGVLAAMLEATRSGRGQVVDAAMVDGASSLMTIFHGMAAFGVWQSERGTNMLDGGAHFYGTYETRDGRWVSVGPVEPQFYDELLTRLGIDASEWSQQMDRSGWGALRERIAAVFVTRTRAEWTELLEGTDVCFAPVLELDEAREHPHLVARNNFIELEGVPQPAPAPRFSRTASQVKGPAVPVGANTRAVLEGAGLSSTEVDALVADAVAVES